MCYSTALRKQREEITKKLRHTFNADFEVSESFQPYYHLNGFSHGNLQIIKMGDLSCTHSSSWGLVPDWAKNDPDAFRKKTNTLNARSESIFEKLSFKISAKEKRCLILADGFFEPHHQNNVPIPHFCFQPTMEDPKGTLFMFAGLYNELDSTHITATILTTAANGFFAELHNKKKRMPLILDETYYKDWLNPRLSQQSINELIATGFTDKSFKAHRVSRGLYKSNFDTDKPYIVNEVQKDTLF